MGSTEMLSDPGVVPPDGVTDSQLPPWAAAVKLRGDPLLDTRTERGCGIEWPDSYSKYAARGGHSLSLPVPEVVVITNFTGIVCGEFDAPLEVMVTVPL